MIYKDRIYNNYNNQTQGEFLGVENKKMKKLVILIGMILILMGTVPAPKPEEPDCSQHSIVLDSGPTWTGDGYNWTYKVCQGQKWDISHIVIGSCICSGYADLAACRTAGVIKRWGVYGAGVSYSELVYGLDGSTGVRGFKFDNNAGWDEGDCAYFWIVTATNQQNTSQVGVVKPDGVICKYTITAPAHGGITVPETAFLVGVIALLTPGVIYVARRKK